MPAKPVARAGKNQEREEDQREGLEHQRERHQGEGPRVPVLPIALLQPLHRQVERHRRIGKVRLRVQQPDVPGIEHRRRNEPLNEDDEPVQVVVAHRQRYRELQCEERPEQPPVLAPSAR